MSTKPPGRRTPLGKVKPPEVPPKKKPAPAPRAPGEPLANQRHECFAQLIAKGEAASRAYVFVYGVKSKVAETNGPRLLGNAGVKERVKELQTVSAKATVLSIEEKREFLASVVRTAIGEVDERSALCQSAEYTDMGRKFKMPCKLKAIELDARLAGEFIEKVEATVKHTHLTLEELEKRERDADA